MIYLIKIISFFLAFIVVSFSFYIAYIIFVYIAKCVEKIKIWQNKNKTYNQKQHIIDIMKADEDDGLYNQIN